MSIPGLWLLACIGHFAVQELTHCNVLAGRQAFLPNPLVGCRRQEQLWSIGRLSVTKAPSRARNLLSSKGLALTFFYLHQGVSTQASHNLSVVQQYMLEDSVRLRWHAYPWLTWRSHISY